MKRPEDLKRELALSGEIVELLDARGPMHSEDICAALGVASRQRFQAATRILLQTTRIEPLRRTGGSGKGFRIVGDHRPAPVSNLDTLAMRRRRQRRAQRVPA